MTTCESGSTLRTAIRAEHILLEVGIHRGYASPGRMPDAIADHFKQDASLAGFALAYGALALAVVALIPGIGVLDLQDENDRVLALAALPFVAGPGVILLLAQLIRPFWGKHRPRAGTTCDICGSRGPTSEVRALKVTGLVVVVVMSQIGARVCRHCGIQAYLKGATQCLAFGWWGILSFFITPGFVLHNLVMIPRILLTTRQRGFVQGVLQEEAEYARLLLATKELDTVVEVLASRTRLNEDEVREFLKSLPTDS